jgi:ACR3 family arsenite efflux pump ArsB
MCTTLTTSAHGDVPAAVFNASVGNFLGIFLTPLLLLGFLDVHSSVPFEQVLIKLVLKVVVPIAVGQAVQCVPFEEIGVFVKVRVRVRVRLEGKNVTLLIMQLCNLHGYTVFLCAVLDAETLVWLQASSGGLVGAARVRG